MRVILFGLFLLNMVTILFLASIYEKAPVELEGSTLDILVVLLGLGIVFSIVGLVNMKED